MCAIFPLWVQFLPVPNMISPRPKAAYRRSFRQLQRSERWPSAGTWIAL